MRKFFDNAFKMIIGEWRTLVVFELLYKIVATSIIVPLLIWILNFSIKKTGYIYLTNDNIINFFKNPISIFFIIILIFFLAFYVLVEMASLSIYFDSYFNNKKIGVFQLFLTAFKRSLNIFNIKNIIFVIFLILIIPITNISLISGLITTIKIPEFIMDFINKAPLFNFLFTMLMISLQTLAINWIFSINYFILENKNFKEATKCSKSLIKGRFFKTLGYILCWNLIIALISVIFYGFVIVCVALLLYFFRNSNKSLAIFLSILYMINLIYLFIVGLLAVPLNFSFISSLYYRYKELNEEDFHSKIEYYNISSYKTQKILTKNKKFIIYLILTLATLINSLYIYRYLNNDLIDNVQLLKLTEITSHRGNSIDAPENTLASIKYAIRDLANYAEIDVQETKDGEIVVFHDSNLKRITGIDKNIGEVNYNEIKNLDAGSWFSPEFKDETIPTLKQVLNIADGKIKLNIEIKPNPTDSNLVESVVKIIEDANFEKNCVITSLNYDCIKKVKALNKDIKTGYILSVAYGNFYDIENVDFFSMEQSFINEKVVREIHNRNKEIHAWTINSPENMIKLIDLDVDNIITDNPILARQIIYSQNTSNKFNNILKLLFK